MRGASRLVRGREPCRTARARLGRAWERSSAARLSGVLRSCWPGGGAVIDEAVGERLFPKRALLQLGVPGARIGLKFGIGAVQPIHLSHPAVGFDGEVEDILHGGSGA